MDTPTSRMCSKCGHVFPRNTRFFYRDKRSPAGLTMRCKKCVYDKIKNRLLADAIEWPCATCGKMFVSKPNVANYHRRTCSKACERKLRGKNATRQRARERGERTETFITTPTGWEMEKTVLDDYQGSFDPF